VVMQRLHLDDLVGHLLEQEGWTPLNLPAIAESEFRIPLGPGRYHLRRVGDLLHPEREPREVLDEFKRSMGSLDFAAQYQQEPVAEGGNLIKWNWLQFYDEPPGRTPDDRIIVSWDTAMSSRELSRAARFSARWPMSPGRTPSRPGTASLSPASLMARKLVGAPAGKRSSG
jgi:hypothetical protein